MTDDLIPWLRTQLDEDTALIERNSGQKGITDDGCFPDYRTYDGEDLQAADDYLAMFNPKRMLAEVDAKRRILALHAEPHECPDWDHALGETCTAYVSADECPTLRLLALPHAGREGYREEWRP